MHLKKQNSNLTVSRRKKWVWLSAPLVLALIANLFLLWRHKISFRTSFLSNLLILLLLVIVLMCTTGTSVWPRKVFSNKRDVFVFILLLAIGILGRVAMFDEYPPEHGHMREEAQQGVQAYKDYKSNMLDRYFPFPSLIAQIGFSLFGISMDGMRWAFVIFGILSIPLFFIAARLFLKNSFSALIATGLFASSAYLIGASRVALEWMSPVFTTSLALLALFYACAHRSIGAFAFAGFANGILALENFSFKLVPLLSVALLIPFFLTRINESYCHSPAKGYSFSNLFRKLPHFVVFAAFGLAVAAPVVLSSEFGLLETFMEGYNRHQSSIQGWQKSSDLSVTVSRWFDKIHFMSKALFVSGGPPEILPESMGIVDIATGLLGLFALVYCAFYWRRSPAKLYLGIAVVSTVVLGGILVDIPTRFRLISLLPWYFLVIGVLIDDLLDITWGYKKYVKVAFVIILTGIIALNFYNFFVVTMNDRLVQNSFYDLNMILVDEIISIQQREPSTNIYLLTHLGHLGSANDYGWLYDQKLVTAAKSPDAFENATGVLLAHDKFIPDNSSLNLSDCREWMTKFNRSRILFCRINQAS